MGNVAFDALDPPSKKIIAPVMTAYAGACGTWMANTHPFYSPQLTFGNFYDIATREDCRSLCEATADCNFVLWKSFPATCYLRWMSQQRNRYDSVDKEAMRLCEPGTWDDSEQLLAMAHMSL